ncbi:MAG: hypothetical protein ABH803_02250 [Candidatus Micrarchaeota archaeon]
MLETIDWDFVSQIGIGLLSTVAIILVAKKNKWGFVVGLASQPFWFITTFLNQQWGVFFVAIVSTFSWAYGVYEWFYKDKKKR